MPDLGKYGLEVISAYLATGAIVIGLLWLTWAQARSSRKALEEAEDRARNG